MDLAQVKEQIKSVSPLSENSWQLLSHSVRAQQFRKGELLLQEGQVCRTIFFITKGYCRSFYLKEGDDITVQFHFENDFMSNTKSLVTGTASAYCIQAGQDTKAILFDRSTLIDLYKQSAEIESLGRKLLERLLIKQEDHAELFKIASPAERYQYLIAHQPAIIQRVPLTHIASYLGIARETLSRIRSKK